MKKLIDGIVYEVTTFPSGAVMESSVGRENHLEPSVEGGNLVVRTLRFDKAQSDYVKDLSVEAIVINGSTVPVVNGEASIPANPGTYLINGFVPFVVESTDPENERLSQVEADNALLMLALAESQIKQQETDQTIAELMLMMAGGQVNV